MTYRLRIDKAEDTQENAVIFLRMVAAAIESGAAVSGECWSFEEVEEINAGQ